MEKLQGKAAAIPGSGLGIGKSTATLLAGEGARIAMIDWSEKARKETTTEINKLGGETYFIEAKVGEPDVIEKTIEEAANLALFLASDGCRLITGSVIRVDSCIRAT